MQSKQNNMLISLKAARSFLTANASALGSAVTSANVQQLDDAITALSGHATNQAGSTLTAQGATQKHQALRHTLLRDHMGPIARIAVLHLPNTPELTPLRMPRGGSTSTERLVAAATGMAQAAAPYTDVFVAAGLPADFIAQLNAAAAAIVPPVVDRKAAKGKVKEATSGLKSNLANGRKIVNVIDAFVRIALKDNASLLANWDSVKRVQRSPVRTKATPAAPVSTPATPTTSTPIATPPAIPAVANAA